MFTGSACPTIEWYILSSWKELSGEGMKLKANKGRLHFVGSYHAAKPLEIAAASEADSADAIETALDNQSMG